MPNQNALVGQSGGPTAVINASLQGVIQAASVIDKIDTLWGMRWGIEGFLAGELVNLDRQKPHIIEGLSRTPSSALGASRMKLAESDLPAVKSMLDRFNIRHLFMIGGNDSMDTIHRIEEFCRSRGYEINAIGIPKTVDNDLYGTDHTPGYPSAARYNALSVQQSGRLARDMRKVDSFVVYQTIGRDAGWLAAATALARNRKDDPPHLIYCPERPFITNEFLEDARGCLDRLGYVSIVVSEGLKFPDSRPVSASVTKDGFGNVEYGAMGGGSVGMAVHRILSDAAGVRGEFQITESLPMCAVDRVADGDVDRAHQCGQKAVQLAIGGESGYMVSIIRQPRGDFSFGTVPLEEVAVRAKAMPENMLNQRGNDVTAKFLDYARPLVGPLPSYVDLEL